MKTCKSIINYTNWGTHSSSESQTSHRNALLLKDISQADLVTGARRTAKLSLVSSISDELPPAPIPGLEFLDELVAKTLPDGEEFIFTALRKLLVWVCEKDFWSKGTCLKSRWILRLASFAKINLDRSSMWEVFLIGGIGIRWRKGGNGRSSLVTALFDTKSASKSGGSLNNKHDYWRNC